MYSREMTASFEQIFPWRANLSVKTNGSVPAAGSYEVVIVGGGSAGITVSARIVKQFRKHRIHATVLIIDPSKHHYYQPMWTLVGGGIYAKHASRRWQQDLIPAGVEWLQDSVTRFHPERNEIEIHSGRKVSYRYLIVCPGLKLNWDAIPGLRESLGQNGISSNYSYGSVESTWHNIRSFRGGTAIFTQPLPPIKCGGAPQKIAYLADSYFRRSGVRDKTNIIFCSAENGIFAVRKYADTLNKVIARKGINAKFRHNLIRLCPETKEAVFRNLDSGAEAVMKYDMIHVTPPQCAMDFVRESPLANGSGWVEVDKHTLQHVAYPNVFSLGDASSLPTSKTGAAVRKQAPVVAMNLISAMKGEPLRASYNGYTSCPLVTGYGSLIMAEFDYELQPRETFPIDQSKERLSMYLVKKYLLPPFYWYGMLRGRV